jgi:hypothetical protein
VQLAFYLSAVGFLSMLASFQRSKHLWCLISKHKATFVCLLALLPLFATQGKQALARDRSKTLSISCFLLSVLAYILLSTKGAYFGVCIFLSTKGAYYGANYL